MMKLKFATILPIIQFAIAAILLQCGYRTHIPRRSEMYMPTTRLICRGLNAPALLFRILNPISWGPRFDWVPRSILGFDTDDVFFLLGVIVIWYLMGRALDRRGDARVGGWIGILLRFAISLILLGLGVILVLAGLHDFGPGRPNNPSFPLGAVLTLAWAIVLIFLPARGFVLTIRGRQAQGASVTVAKRR